MSADHDHPRETSQARREWSALARPASLSVEPVETSQARREWSALARPASPSVEPVETTRGSSPRDAAEPDHRHPDGSAVHEHSPHAVIVGVGAGLGASLARTFARHGHDLTLIARTPASTGPVAEQASAAGRRVLELHVDVGDLEGLAAAIAEARAWQPVTRLHHNASRHTGSLLDADPEELREAIAVNALAAVTAVRVALPDLVHVGGTVTWTGAGAAIHPSPEYGVLSQGKAALRAAAFALAPELAALGVRLRMVTIRGSIAAGGPLDPDRIAAIFWEHAEDPQAGVERLLSADS